jgi:putative membrane protein
MTAAVNPAVNPWAFEANPEIWLLVGSIVVFGWYAVHRIGPLVVAAGQPIVTRAQKRYFVAGVLILWFASDWPMHGIAEEYLFSASMAQHLLIAFVVPPLLLLAMPEWLARLLVLDSGRLSKVLRVLTRPIVAGVIFNVLALLSVWAVVVTLGTESETFHYVFHVSVFASALLMWFPVLGPLKELHLSEPGKLIYLFSMSIVPTVPAGWLAMAEGVIYKAYDNDVRLFGMSPTTDQQIAGVIMKVIGGFYLWTLIAIRFFRYTAAQREKDIDSRLTRSRITYADAERAFERSGEARREPQKG